MVAGEMMDSLGTKKLFAVFSACSLATLVLYFGYVNILVHVRSWIKTRKTKVTLKLKNTSTTSSDGKSESAQLLLASDDCDNSDDSDSSDKSDADEADVDSLS